MLSVRPASLGRLGRGEESETKEKEGLLRGARHIIGGLEGADLWPFCHSAGAEASWLEMLRPLGKGGGARSPWKNGAKRAERQRPNRPRPRRTRAATRLRPATPPGSSRGRAWLGPVRLATRAPVSACRAEKVFPGFQACLLRAVKGLEPT